jgi:hypothetical protein
MDIAPVGNPAQAVLAGPDTASPNPLTADRELIRNIQGIDASGLFGAGSELAFALDRDTKQLVVRVVNQHTGEILWQAPPEYMLQLARTFGQYSG